MKSAPTPPTPPDPTVVAAAQAGANQQTAETQASLNNMNYQGPQGTVSYNQFSPDRWQETVNLSPEQQGIYNSQTSAERGALNLANEEVPRIGQALGTNVTPGYINASVSTPGLQSTYDQGGQIQKNLDPSSMGDPAVQQAEDAAYRQQTQYLDPQWKQATEQQNAQLVAQGLNPNDAAWQNSMQLFGNQENQAYGNAGLQAVGAGQAEQNTLFGQGATAGQFANSAQAQANTENQGAAGFANTAQNQQFTNAQNAYQFGNQAEAQQFQQNAYAQNLPINEFGALESGGQVSMPGGATYTPTSVAPTDVTGAYALNTQANQANYQAKMANYQSGLGGLFSLGSAAIMASDERLKTDIRRIGQTDEGHNLYLYRFKGSPDMHVGVMAQELRQSRPDLVFEGTDGVLRVNYGGLG